ncbi:MAG TPA: carboxypeptidase-like regulatory domain-containing protein [Chitinophagaceae bacterium]|nr:carboxypeptidase-like regulatory domain-containing protein [Chitinophagaceae bacterium]
MSVRKAFPAASSLAFIVSLLIILVIGCQRELSAPPGGNNPPTTPGAPIDDVKVTAGVRGIVLDENDHPVMGATVKCGNQTATTDRYGTFRFSNVSLSKANGFVKVTRNGYYNSIRSFVTTAGRMHSVRIRLLPKTNSGNFSGTTGGTISIAGGGKLVIPADAITDAGGAGYTGTVNVAMTWIDPTSGRLADMIPGDLRGLTTTGDEMGLETFGMLGVELTGSGGQTLKIATGKTAELSFPIPASIVGAAPATIDLWNFDENTARWKQEGRATKTGNFYIGQVSHFSFWNCDASFPVVNLCMHLIAPTESNPLNNVQVRIKRPNGSYGYGRTDSLGNLCGKVPKSEALILEILDQCGNVIYTQNIGPFSNDSDLGAIPVTLPATQTLTISGMVVDCSGNPVANGSAVIYTDGGHAYSVGLVNGVFSLTLLRCNNATLNFNVLGIDNTTLQQGNPVGGTGTTGTVNVGSVQACGTSAVQFIEFLVDGAPSNYTSPPDNINMSDSMPSPPYSQKPMIYGYAPGSGNTSNYSSFTFSSNASPGVYPLLSCFLSTGPSSMSQQILTSSPTITITNFGAPVTGFIEGNFTIQMNFAGTPKTVVCNFKVRRH